MTKRPWIGFDLDSTLAMHESGASIDTIGEPIPLMIARLMHYLNENKVDVKIITARVSMHDDEMFRHMQRNLIEEWCYKHIGRRLEVTSEKDFMMLYMYDDRCKQVIPNTGQLVEDFVSNGVEEHDVIMNAINEG